MSSRPAGLPADVRTKLITAFRAAIQDPRFKEFAKKNAFLVDDLTGDALDQGSRQRRQRARHGRGTGLPKDQKE